MLDKSAKYIGVLIATLWSNGAFSDNYDQFRVVCSGGDSATAATALAEAKTLINKTIPTLPPRNSPEGVRFKRWFGGPEGDYDSKVRDIYSAISLTLVFSRIWCPNMSTPNSDPGTLAWVPADAVSELFLEAEFFALSTTGADSQAGTIIHEAAHLSFVSDVVDSDVTGDNLPDYGVANAEQLSRTQPALSRRTSDNFQYYAEDVAYGLP